MAFTETTTEYLTSHKRDDGIYVLTVLKPTRIAVDQWIARVEEIWQIHNETREPILIISDSSLKENIPLSYAFSEGIKVARRYPSLPKGRTAFIVKSSILTSMLNTFLRLMPLNIEFRYFESTGTEDAVRWLLALREGMQPASNA